MASILYVLAYCWRFECEGCLFHPEIGMLMLCYVGYFFVSASDEMNQIPVICIHLLVFEMP